MSRKRRMSPLQCSYTPGRKAKMIHTSKLFTVWIVFHACLREAHLYRSKHRERNFLHYKFTVLSRAETFPEFSAEVVYDGRRIKHYSNEKRVWILTEDWTDVPGEPSDPKEWFIHQIRTLSNCADSQCSELHVLQRIIGCELEKLPDGSVNLTVFDEYGFDGEDLISFNSDTAQWIDKSPKAKRTKVNWDRQTRRNIFIKHYLMNCTKWISTFINTEKSSPDVCVSMRTDESKLVLTCLATGFYPRDVQMDIRLYRNKLENQTSSGIRPNPDGSFQMRTSVKIDRNHGGSYDCLLNHSSLRKPVSVVWVGNCAECETEPEWPFTLVVAAAFAVLVFTVISYYSYLKQRLNGTMSSYRDKIRNKVQSIIVHHIRPQ